MVQRVHDYWWKDVAPFTGYLNVTLPTPFPVPNWWITGHEAELTFSDLATVVAGANAFEGTFDTMQSDPRFATQVGRFLGFNLGMSGQTDAWDDWNPGSKTEGYICDCREGLWNSFAFRKTGEILGVAYGAITDAFADAQKPIPYGFHYRHHYKATWTYDSEAGYGIQTSPWDWGDCAGSHQAPAVYGELLQQWRWNVRTGPSPGTGMRPGSLLPYALEHLSDPNFNLMNLGGDETGYTAFAQYYAAVVSSAAASAKPIIAYLDQSWFEIVFGNPVPLPRVGNVHGTEYWNELVLR